MSKAEVDAARSPGLIAELDGGCGFAMISPTREPRENFGKI